jgi:hypothetical protein
MRHRFLPFPCLRLVRSGTASGGSRILSAETSSFVLTHREICLDATASSPVIFKHSTDRSMPWPSLIVWLDVRVT